MDAEELRTRNRTGDGWVPRQLVPLLIESGHADVVQQQAEQGDWFCAQAWSRSLREQSAPNTAVAVLAPFAASGWWPAVDHLANLLLSLDRLDETVALLMPHVEAGLPHHRRAAADKMAGTLARLGRHGEAFEVLRSHLTGDWVGATLVEELVRHGLDDEIHDVLRDAVAGPGQFPAVGLMARFHERRQQPDVAINFLRSWIESSAVHYGHHIAQLADILDRHGRLAELRELPVPLNDGFAARQLAQGYAKAGDLAAAEEVLRPFIDLPDPTSAVLLSRIYTASGRLDEALAVLDEITGEGLASFEVLAARTKLLSALGRGEEALAALTAHPETDSPAGRMLTAELLRDLGRADEAIALLGDPADRSELLTLLETLILQGRVDDAMERVHSWRTPSPESGSH